MRKEDIRKYQLSQLELMDYVDEISRRIGIRYYLIGGTLLGAIRHKGFIPWDADMDIAMTRTDYETFRRYCEQHATERYYYQHYTNEKNHLSPHAILRIKNTHVVTNTRKSRYKPKNDGIYLDIFPLDTPPVSEKKQEKQMMKIKRINRIIEIKAGYMYGDTGIAKRIFKRIVQIAMCPISFSYLNRKLDSVMQKYSTENSNCLVSMASRYSYRKQLMPKDIYAEPVLVEFEGKMYSAPACVEEYLKRIYGDYMQLPPEDKRFSELDNIDYVDYGE